MWKLIPRTILLNLGVHGEHLSMRSLFASGNLMVWAMKKVNNDTIDVLFDKHVWRSMIHY
jgi:hypothetical protein